MYVCVSQANSFLTDSQTRMLYAFISSPFRAMFPALLILDVLCVVSSPIFCCFGGYDEFTVLLPVALNVAKVRPYILTALLRCKWWEISFFISVLDLIEFGLLIR